MSKSTIQGFGDTTFDLEPREVSPEVAKDLSQALVRLMVWDAQNHIWRGASGDIDGRLIISMSGVPVNVATYGTFAVGVAAQMVLPQNPNRRQVIFLNMGAVDIYIGFNAALTQFNGMLLSVGSAWDDNLYTGPYWMVSTAAGQNVRYMEF